MAADRGLYRQAGLAVKIVDGGPGRSPARWLQQGRAEFASFWLSSGIRLYDRGVKLENLAQIVQKSALMLVARKQEGILKPRDINGRRVALWGAPFNFPARLFFRKFDLQVIPVRLAGSINPFLCGAVSVTAAMWYNEYHKIINAGLNPDELTSFRFADYGLDFPEDGIYVMAAYRKKHPRVCRAFVRASLAGWQLAFDEPEQALALTMARIRKAHITSNLSQQRWMLEKMKIIMTPAAGGRRGALDPRAFARTARGLVTLGVIDRIPDFHRFHPLPESASGKQNREPKP